MNFFALPSEIKELIFSFLSPGDLYHCLNVCHDWRAISNCERLWKNALIGENIDFSDFDEDGNNNSLVSKYAQLWKTHNNTCISWDLNSFSQQLIPYETSEELTCVRIFVFMNKMALISNKIQLFSFTKKSCSKETISLPFVPHALTMNNKYIICSVGNILLIFKKNQSFRKYCAIALLNNSSLIIEKEKIKGFVERKQKFGPYIKTEVLVGEHLWVSCLLNCNQILNVINLKTLDIINTNLNPRLVCATKHKIVVSTRDRIHVFNSAGDLQSVFSPEPGFTAFRPTDNYIVTSENIGGRVSIWTIDGKFVWAKDNFCFQFKLDLTRHLMYACSGSKLGAYSLKTGNLVWSSELPDVHFNQIDDMFLVCDKYLVVDVYLDSPFPNFHSAFIFDLNAETLLYKTILRGFTMHVTDKLWVQKRQDDLIVNVY